MIQSFFSWIGGKYTLCQELIPLFPPHKVYIEPFLGSGVVFLNKSKAGFSILNDKNKYLHNLFQCCKYDLDDLIVGCELLVKDRNTFDYFKRTIRRNPDQIEKAVMFLYLVNCSFNTSGNEFYFRCPTDFKNDDWTNKILNICKTIHKKLNTDTVIENLDFSNLLWKYVYHSKEDIFIYLDPPYYCANDTDYYKHVFSKNQHLSLYNCLNIMPSNVKWLLSYDDVPEIRDYYCNFNIFNTKGVSYTMSLETRPRKSELIITNYEINQRLF